MQCDRTAVSINGTVLLILETDRQVEVHRAVVGVAGERLVTEIVRNHTFVIFKGIGEFPGIRVGVIVRALQPEHHLALAVLQEIHRPVDG